MFKDCFGQEIKDGDDVLISIVRQVWEGDKEIMVHHTYYSQEGNKLSNIYRL